MTAMINGEVVPNQTKIDFAFRLPGDISCRLGLHIPSKDKMKEQTLDYPAYPVKQLRDKFTTYQEKLQKYELTPEEIVDLLLALPDQKLEVLWQGSQGIARITLQLP